MDDFYAYSEFNKIDIGLFRGTFPASAIDLKDGDWFVAITKITTTPGHADGNNNVVGEQRGSLNNLVFLSAPNFVSGVQLVNDRRDALVLQTFNYTSTMTEFIKLRFVPVHVRQLPLHPVIILHNIDFDYFNVPFQKFVAEFYFVKNKV